jgi:hypothetical protein
VPGTTPMHALQSAALMPGGAREASLWRTCFVRLMFGSASYTSVYTSRFGSCVTSGVLPLKYTTKRM